MRTVETVFISEAYVVCPICREYNDGFHGSPLGEVIECQGCGKEFMVDEDAEVVFK